MCVVSFPQTEAGFLFISGSAKEAERARVMFTKTNYTRFLFVFIVYLGVNLLIIRIRSSNQVHEKVLKILKNRVLISEYHKDVTTERTSKVKEKLKALQIDLVVRSII